MMNVSGLFKIPHATLGGVSLFVARFWPFSALAALRFVAIE